MACCISKRFFMYFGGQVFFLKNFSTRGPKRVSKREPKHLLNGFVTVLFLVGVFSGVFSAVSANEQPGEPVMRGGHLLPMLQIEDVGEMQLQPDDSVVYHPWSTDQLIGKVRVIQHMAGRHSAKTLNQPFMDAITRADFPKERYQTTTIVNVDDSPLGGSLIVKHKVESKKRQYPWASFVLDANGLAQKQWRLTKKSSAIFVLDATGKVLWFKDGAMTPDEIKQGIFLLQGALKKPRKSSPEIE